jgi:hypothetical protein
LIAEARKAGHLSHVDFLQHIPGERAMGIVAEGSYVQTMVTQQLIGLVMSGLQEAASQTSSGAANGACSRWFGDSSDNFRKDLASRIRKMRSNINVRVIKVSMEALVTRNRYENASAWNDGSSHLRFEDSYSHIGTAGGIKSEIYVNEAYASLPQKLVLLGDGSVDSSFWNQSRYETLIHELSHLILGTKDEKLSKKTVAYGAQNAEALARKDPSKAKTNAENFAIFIEAAGLNKNT